jgi:hypothetical protein
MLRDAITKPPASPCRMGSVPARWMKIWCKKLTLLPLGQPGSPEATRQ